MSASIKKARILQKRVFQLLILFFPTQLALHFWPESAFIFGIRVDYLSPAIYLTDILLLALFLTWLFTKRTIKRPGVWALAGILFVVINIFVATRPEVSLYKWVKILAFSLFSYFVVKSKEFDFEEWVSKPLKLSLLVISIIGLAQFIYQQSIGGLLYYLGERSFSSQTPGIALAPFFGELRLRAYSVFSHPNSLAGFLVASLSLLYLGKERIKKGDLLIIGLSLFTLFFTFSKAAQATLILVAILYFVQKRAVLSRNIFKPIFTGVLLMSILFPLFAQGILSNSRFDEPIEKRLVLASAAGEVISEKPVLGVGLNNFIVHLPNTSLKTEYIWNLQPVHNIFLLLLAETGLVGFVLFSSFLFKILKTKDSKVLYCLTAIILTGFFDHYWLTLQQNLLLLFLVFGLSFRRLKVSS